MCVAAPSRHSRSPHPRDRRPCPKCPPWRKPASQAWSPIPGTGCSRRLERRRTGLAFYSSPWSPRSTTLRPAARCWSKAAILLVARRTNSPPSCARRPPNGVRSFGPRTSAWSSTMPAHITHRRRLLAGMTGLTLVSRSLRAPERPAAVWTPARPLRLIVPFAEGGSADQTARMLAEPMSAALGQPVVVENRPGGGAPLGAQLVARAAPDGLTLLYGTPGPQIINPHLMRSLPYNPERDFAPVVSIMRAPNLLCVHPSVAAHSVPELIALAKAQSGRLAFASSGVGSS